MYIIRYYCHYFSLVLSLFIIIFIIAFLSVADSSFKTRISPLTWLCPLGIVRVPPQTGWNIFTGTKPAEWIGENLQEALGFPDKGNVRVGRGSGWTAAELNHILQAHVVDGTLTSFGCVQWESDQILGRNACQMLPVQAAKAALSWREPTGILVNAFFWTFYGDSY